MLLTLPASSVAEPGFEIHPGAMELILPVEQKGDYVIAVSANERQHVQLVVEGPSSTTEYSTKGRVSSRRIEAAFGTLGRINVRLHLVPLPSDPPHEGRCRGRSPLYQEGSYSGTIVFAHQGDVPEVSAMHGHVYFERRFRQLCKRERPLSRLGGKNKLNRKIEVSVLTVSGKSDGRTVLLQAVNLALRSSPLRSAGHLSIAVYERLDRVRIMRNTSVSIDKNSFAMSERGTNPETIRIELSGRFDGHALYSHSQGYAPNWTGDLSVNLPGIGSIPLTGLNFSAILCRGSLTNLDSCSRSG